MRISLLAFVVVLMNRVLSDGSVIWPRVGRRNYPQTPATTTNFFLQLFSHLCQWSLAVNQPGKIYFVKCFLIWCWCSFEGQRWLENNLDLVDLWKCLPFLLAQSLATLVPSHWGTREAEFPAWSEVSRRSPGSSCPSYHQVHCNHGNWTFNVDNSNSNKNIFHLG